MPFNPLASILGGQAGRLQFDKTQAQQNLAQAAGQQGFNPAFSPEMQQVAAFSGDPEAQFAKLGKQRQQIFFDDAQKGLSLAKAGRWDEVSRLANSRIVPLLQSGGDPSDSIQIAQAIENQDFEGATAMLQSGVDAGIQTGFLKGPAKKALKQQTKGGLVFDPNTGTYAVDEVAKKRFDELAQKKQQGGLSFKDRQGLNKDITAMTKDAVSIKTAANELIGLMQRGSAAARLGAVFKFMKSLDPTSVVRETEQGQVYAAQGAGSQLAGMINGLLGKGKLTDAGFLDLVETAKNISNSNLSSTQETVDALLNTFEGTLTKSFSDKIKLRVPKPFELGGSKNITVDF